MGTKRKNMWSLLALIGAIVIAFAVFMEKRETSVNQKKTHEETKEFTKEQIDGLDKKSQERHEELLKKLGLNEKSGVLLKQLLGNDFIDVLDDNEAFNSLKQRLEKKSLVEILDENKELKERINSIEFLNNTTFKESILYLLSALKYESARKIIDNYINDNANLKPEFLAQLYDFKALTFSGKDLNHNKRKENFDKAIELDPFNPIILGHYGKYLNYNDQREKAISVLEKALILIDNGQQIKPFDHVEILTILSNAIFHRELKKTKVNRDFTFAKEHLKRAVEINTKLSNKDSKLHIIYRYWAEIHMANAEYDDAIKLLNKSIDYEKNIIGDKPTIYTAIAYMDLGTCFAYKVISGSEDYENGLNAYSKALCIFKLIDGEKHIHIADVYNNLGNLEKHKEIDKAIEHYKMAIKITEDYEIKHVMKLAASYANLARAYGIKSVNDMALYNAEKALSLYRQKLPENHEEILYINGLINHLKK